MTSEDINSICQTVIVVSFLAFLAFIIYILR
jgi:preprotein translocase subunit SecE